jgi:type VI secretion system protein ImpH
VPGAGYPLGHNNRVGVDLVVGEHVWDVRSKFRLRLGPLGWDQFRSLMPDGPELRPLAELTRTFVGPELDFDVQLVLAAELVPAYRIDPAPESGFFLGWNTWIDCPGRLLPAEDAVFQVSEI